MSEYPSDWTTTQLQEIISTIESGSRPKGGVRIGDNSKGVPSYGGENISMNGGMLYDSVRMVPTSFATEMRRGVLSDKDVLINKDGANTGKSAIYRKPAGEEFATINEHLFLLRCNKGIAEQEFLYHFLNSEFGKSQITRVITGSAQPGLNSTFPEFVRIDLPPLPEQKRIAEILSGIDKVIHKQKIKIQQSKNLLMSLLAEKFASGKIDRKFLLDEISEFITYGLTVRPQYVKQGIPMISAGECKNGFIDFEKAKKISQTDFSQVRGKTIPAKGDLLITKTGTLGRVAVVQASAPEFTITQNVALIRPKRKEALPEYLAYYLISPGCQREIKDKTSTLAIPDLQLGILANFYIPLPSIDEQKEISLLLASVADEIKVVEKRVTAYELLKNSLAQDLLSGRKRVGDAWILEGVGV